MLFIANQILERICKIHIPVLYSYLDDLLAIPVTLGIYQLGVHFLNKEKSKTIPLSFILLCIIAFTFHFELLLPLLSDKYTADVIDVFMYMSGGIFYFLVFTHVRKNIAKTSSYEN
jgi:glycopeptide antibiotics resistance protein